ncbi:ribosome biogenesis GTPase YlqF [Eubacterium sp.]|uniref:ribosome biogenesis GTPase YlqF n=1 Tax=Eubacterium sp. TaxID=142586 RepID=UPI0025E9E60D|nr:ribosome biogenesis GTPase YlqF [Eubacterium sp.]MCR5629710.1 ribosome biogenesis GTPase YlqF [Eubacterium sp.]
MNNQDNEKVFQKSQINWFPGHMAKTRRKIKEIMPLINAVAEVVDARIPISSRNPEIKELIGEKPHIILLNKCDMADKSVTEKWIKHYKSQGIIAIAIDCKSGKGLSLFKDTVKTALAEKLEAYAKKGMIGKPLRVMVVGIPNVGKSSFINRIAGKTRAKVENRPGVTRGNQWFTIDRQLELLDTPGVLWPKFEDKTVGERLAFTGAIKDRILDIELLAIRLLELLSADYPKLLVERYGELEFDCDSYDLLCQIGKKRGMVIKGGETDTERAAAMLLEEYRNCKIGLISLERVENDA